MAIGLGIAETSDRVAVRLRFSVTWIGSWSTTKVAGGHQGYRLGGGTLAAALRADCGVGTVLNANNGSWHMTMTVGRASHFGVAIVGVALIVALSVASPAQADSCSITGTFGFTVTGGTGLLFLSTDGGAEIDLLPGHNICDSCLTAGRTLRGTYRTTATDQGCYFTMELSNPDPPPIVRIVGVPAFEGRQLLFLGSTAPDFASGLALRIDTLTGR